MKKLLSVALLLVVSFVCLACGQGESATVAASNGSGRAEKASAPSSKALVVYFSATGTTAEVGNRLADILQADIYALKAAKSYTKEDLNYHDNQTRATLEQNDPNARPEIAGSLPDVSQYETVYLGYPIWWGLAPKIMYSFVEGCDLSGKRVIPFCVSAQSDIGGSADALQEICKGKADWKQGKRFAAGATKQEIEEWLKTVR